MKVTMIALFLALFGFTSVQANPPTTETSTAPAVEAEAHPTGDTAEHKDAKHAKKAKKVKAAHPKKAEKTEEHPAAPAPH